MRHQHEGERRGRRIVDQGEELRLDDVPDHRLVGPAEQLRVDEVAGGGDERQHGRREHARQRERQRHPHERPSRARVEVLGRLDQPPVDLLERDVDRQDRERQVVVGDPGDDGRRGGEQPAVVGQQPDRPQHADDRPVVGEDRLPRDRPDQVGDEERRDDEDEEDVLPLPRPEGDPVRERVAERERQHGRDPRVPERPHELLAVVRERLAVVGELPGELVAREDPALQRLVGEEPERDARRRPPATPSQASAAPTGRASGAGGRTSSPCRERSYAPSSVCHCSM